MTTSSTMILSSLISNRRSLSEYLTLSYQNQLRSQPQQSVSAKIWIHEPYPFLRSIDSSWLQPHQLNLLQLCNSPQKRLAYFAQHALWIALTECRPNIIPFQMATQLEFGDLLDLSKEQLSQCFYFLGLFDLALDLRRLVETKTMQDIQNALTKRQTVFITKLAKAPSSVDFGSMDLKSWNGAIDTLQEMLLHRGTNRFAKAIFGIDDQLIWYLERIQSLNDANTWKSQIKDLNNPSAHASLCNELKMVCEYIKGSTV